MEKIIGKKYIITNIYRIQADYSIIWGYVFSGFISFLLKSKSFLDGTNLFSPNEKMK